MKVLHLDLEDTIIEPVSNGWFNTRLMNVDKVKTVIDKFQPDEVHVFSFAVWDPRQLALFNMGTRERIERVLGVKIVAVPTVDEDIVPACCAVLGLSPTTVTFQEVSDFWGKDGAFKLYLRHIYKNNSTPLEVLLLDDAVYNETFEYPNINVKGQIVNILELDED